MKTIALVGLVTLCSAGAYAQGVVTYVPLASGIIDAQVYSPNPVAPTIEIQGDTAAQNTVAGNSTVGSVTYTGMTPIGGASYTGATPVTLAGAGSSVYTYGNLFTSELYALSTTTSVDLPGGTVLSQLSPVTQYQSTFAINSAGFGAGYFNQAAPPNPDPGIPGTGHIGAVAKSTKGAAYLGNNAAAIVVAWFNGGGQFTTLAQAQAANVPWGQSLPFEITGLIEPASVMTDDNNGVAAPAQSGTAYLADNLNANTYLESFSLTSSPEPSTIALGVMGACAFLARRRKK